MSCAGAPDLSHCSFVEFNVGLYEHELAFDHPSTWPAAATRGISRELAGWAERNPARAVICSRTFGSSTARVCRLTLWHEEKRPWPSTT